MYLKTSMYQQFAKIQHMPHLEFRLPLFQTTFNRDGTFSVRFPGALLTLSLFHHNVWQSVLKGKKAVLKCKCKVPARQAVYSLKTQPILISFMALSFLRTQIHI